MSTPVFIAQVSETNIPEENVTSRMKFEDNCPRILIEVGEKWIVVDLENEEITINKPTMKLYNE